MIPYWMIEIAVDLGVISIGILFFTLIFFVLTEIMVYTKQNIRRLKDGKGNN